MGCTALASRAHPPAEKDDKRRLAPSLDNNDPGKESKRHENARATLTAPAPAPASTAAVETGRAGKGAGGGGGRAHSPDSRTTALERQQQRKLEGKEIEEEHEEEHEEEKEEEATAVLQHNYAKYAEPRSEPLPPPLPPPPLPTAAAGLDPSNPYATIRCDHVSVLPRSSPCGGGSARAMRHSGEGGGKEAGTGVYERYSPIQPFALYVNYGIIFILHAPPRPLFEPLPGDTIHSCVLLSVGTRELRGDTLRRPTMPDIVSCHTVHPALSAPPLSRLLMKR